MPKGQHQGGRPKETEVYGFVAYMISFVVFGTQQIDWLNLIQSIALFMLWAFIPDSVLRSIGIFYYPNKYWALVLPTWLVITVIFTVVFYIGLNMALAAPANSKSTITDEFSNKIKKRTEKGGIDPIGDLPISLVNSILYSASRPEISKLGRSLSTANDSHHFQTLKLD